ncbi:hypothetical protein [Algoriphagus boritolerans]|uniref:hypothetical protein n=1 Tax=Algoriphagus boritolerans TaxID=308111 RepID=UPI000AF2C611
MTTFFGGAKTFPAKLFLGDPSGKFKESPQEAFLADALSEDTDAVFFDADGDGDLDLFVTSGGNESGFGSPDLADRLYLNDGKGNFNKKKCTRTFYRFQQQQYCQTDRHQ